MLFKVYYIVFSILLTLAVQTASAADTIVVKVDSVPAVTPEDTASLVKMQKKVAKQKRDWTKWTPNPKRAMWLAIVLPGAGQIYNRKFWKLPIVYGGLVGCAYAMSWNNQMYHDYSQAYNDLIDNDPSTQSYVSFLKHTTITSSNIERYKTLFKSRKDTYRRWRDLSFFCMVAVYAISIIDAYVDASLSKFDISDDISLRVQPAVVNGTMKTPGNISSPSDPLLNNSGIGVHGALTF